MRCQRHASHNQRRSLLLWMIPVAAAAATLVFADVPRPPTETAAQQANAELAAAGRLREGTRIVDQLGTFQITGDRATFQTLDGKYRLGGLPNLNLERIVRAIRDDPDHLIWSASGSITEYQGSNYLLISHAVLKSKQSSSALDPTRPGGLEDSQP